MHDLPAHPGGGTLTLDGALPAAWVDALLTLWRGLPIAPKDKPSPIDRSYYDDVDGCICNAIDHALTAGGILPPPDTLTSTPLPLPPPALPLPEGSEGGEGGLGNGGEGGEGGDGNGGEGGKGGGVNGGEGGEGDDGSGGEGGGGMSGGGEGGSGEGSRRAVDVVDGAVGTQSAGLRYGTQPLMRFLHYPHPGGSLPAHVDLPRIVNGVRTTHSFLLYLTDCELGGETLLLEARRGDEKLAPSGGVAAGERAVLARSAPRRGRLLIMPHACPHSAAPVISAPKLLIRGEVLLPAQPGGSAVGPQSRAA